MVLGVSQTTIKRWVLNFSQAFHKDSFGHYKFTDQDMNCLLYIKKKVEEGERLDQIILPRDYSFDSRQSEIKETIKNNGINSSSEMLYRIRQIERTLMNKADEVVSMQVLQHRNELEDLRQMVEQLAASVEALQRKNDTTLYSSKDTHRSPQLQLSNKKKGLFRSLFQ